MHLHVDRSQLLKAIAHGQSVVERKNTIPILGNVLLEVRPEALSLTTTNMDLALIETIPAQISAPGKTTVSAHLLYDIVRKLPENVLVELKYVPETAQLMLKAGRSRFQMPCLPVEDFPQLHQETLPFQFTLPANELKILIDRTRFAMSTEETRYYLNGIHFHTQLLEGDILLRSVATDSHRLACLETLLSTDLPPDIPAIIVGRKTITELRKLLDEVTDTVNINLSSTRIQFHMPQAVLSSRLIDGTFPDYKSAIPRQNDKRLLVNTKEFFAAVDRVATVAQDNLHAIKLMINQDMLTLSAVGQEAGSAVEEIPIQFPHEPIEIGFNARYLLDMAGQIDDEETEISLADGKTAILIQGANDGRSLYVLMPIRG